MKNAGIVVRAPGQAPAQSRVVDWIDVCRFATGTVRQIKFSLDRPCVPGKDYDFTTILSSHALLAPTLSDEVFERP